MGDWKRVASGDNVPLRWGDRSRPPPLDGGGLLHDFLGKMLLSIQFPIADSRAFADSPVNLLGRPNWPSVSPDVDFVRSFGSIRRRRLGGVVGWIGEGAICEADRALRFPGISTFKDSESGLRIPLSLAFRRFYFDGLAVGKFEVGLTSREWDISTLSRKQTKDFINHFLKLPVVIPALSPKAISGVDAGQSVSSELGRAGKPLTRFYAACSLKHPPPVHLTDWWVLNGSPVLFLVHEAAEKIQIPFRSRLVPRNEDMDCDLSYCEVPYSGRTIGMWVLGLTEYTFYRDVRALKICLLRLHAEHEVLTQILKNLATGNISIQPRSSASNLLQLYLSEATKRISRLSSEADKLSQADLAELARATQDLILPGDRDALLSSLKKIDVRLNIFHKVEKYVDAKIYAQEVIMGDQYNVDDSQVAAVGPNANVYNNVFNQWKQIGEDMNLANLAKDLSKLRLELKKQGTEAEHDAAAGEIAAAEIAAGKNDGPKVFEHLKNAGAWALGIATTIGVPIAVEALKKAVGL